MKHWPQMTLYGGLGTYEQVETHRKVEVAYMYTGREVEMLCLTAVYTCVHGLVDCTWTCIMAVRDCFKVEMHLEVE